MVNSTSAIPTISTKKPNFSLSGVNRSNDQGGRDRSITFGKGAGNDGSDA